VTAPKVIEIVDIRPGTVRAVVDRIIEKKLKVLPVLDKSSAGRYEIVRTSPQYVIAEGPARVVEKVTTIETLAANGDFRPARKPSMSDSAWGSGARQGETRFGETGPQRQSGKETPGSDDGSR
jgi:hypothetical protein